MALSKTEAAYIAAFLEELDDRFGNDGCNDMYVPDTPENRTMVAAAEQLWAGTNETEPAPLQVRKKRISTGNETVIAYLKKRLCDEYGLDEADIPGT